MRNKDNIYDQIRQARSENQKLLAILLDPDKDCLGRFRVYHKINESPATHIFIGGSSCRLIELMN
jgi:putative glycerol-1-phosphate prenyltransferase